MFKDENIKENFVWKTSTIFFNLKLKNLVKAISQFSSGCLNLRSHKFKYFNSIKDIEIKEFQKYSNSYKRIWSALLLKLAGHAGMSSEKRIQWDIVL